MPRPRTIFAPRMEWTDEVQAVGLPILRAAAAAVVQRMGLCRTRYIERDELVNHGWLYQAIQCRSVGQMQTHLYLNARREMYKYAQRQGHRCGGGWELEDLEALIEWNLPDEGDYSLEDVLGAIEHPLDREIVSCVAQGMSFEAIGQGMGYTGARIGQRFREAVKTVRKEIT